MDKKGFTLIELMIVIIIIGIITSIAIPNYIRVHEKAMVASLMANMHAVQVEVEIYQTDKRVYPSDVVEIPIPTNCSNPFGEGLPVLQNESSPDVKGVVEYEVEDDLGFYWITGIDGKLQKLDIILTPGTHLF